MDFQTNGSPFETPQGATLETYAATPPTFGRAFGAMFGDTSASGVLSRAVQRGQFKGSSIADQGLLAIQNDLQPGLYPEPGSVETPLLAAAEANEKYGPIGADGKRVKIADAPMPEGVAKLVGKAKAEEIDREGVLSRYSQAHSFPVTFGAGVAAFLLDPLNLGTMFLPGIGEEAIAARLGAGLAARIAARGAAGAATASIAQAPLSALRYGFGTEEASDYDLRAVFRDMAFAAAGGAVLHAGFGALGDFIKSRRLPAEGGPPGAPPPDPLNVIHADAATTADAMRSGVSQIAEGRMVDVLPVFDENAIRLMSEEAGLRERRAELGELSGNLEIHPEAEAARDTLARLEAVERRLGEPEIEAAERKALTERRDELLTNTNPETLRERAIGLEIKRSFDAQQANIEARLAEIDRLKTQAQAQIALSTLPKLAQKQGDLYREGFTPGLSQDQVRASSEAMYGRAEPSEPAAGEAAKPPNPAQGPAKVENLDQDISLAEKELKALQGEEGPALHPEDAAELKRTEEAMQAARDFGSALKEAATCLVAAGA